MQLPNSRLAPHMQEKIVREFQDVFMVNKGYFPMKDEMELEELLEYPILMLSPRSTTSEYLHQIFCGTGPETPAGSRIEQQ